MTLGINCTFDNDSWSCIEISVRQAVPLRLERTLPSANDTGYSELHQHDNSLTPSDTPSLSMV